MWTYESSTGKLFDAAMNLAGQGYSGGGLDKTNEAAASGKNNPSAQNIHNIGPIPEGMYTLEAPADSHVVGRYALRLVPDEDNEMYGRSAFFEHGDSVVDPGWASDGCIIQDYPVRVSHWASGDRRLKVVAKV